MKISDIIARGKPSLSFEVFPPKKRTDLSEAESREAMNRTRDVVAQIAAEHPSFISVTYGAAGGTTGANTCALARFVQESCGVPALAHLTCISSDREKIADELKSFHAAGIENILCLRGDRPVEAGREGTPRTDLRCGEGPYGARPRAPPSVRISRMRSTLCAHCVLRRFA